MTMEIGDGRAFAIATHLLDETQSGWSNLGYWHEAGGDRFPFSTNAYAEACAALAQRVGAAITLRSDDRLLELGCGQGASLRFWQREFGVKRLAAIERQRVCVDALASQVPDGVSVHHGRFDVRSLPAALRGERFTAVVCVDAAYHAASLTDFLSCAASALQADGRLAFTTLMPRESASVLRRLALRWMLTGARIPAASVQGERELHEALVAAGFSQVQVQRLDAHVFNGFASFVVRRQMQLPWYQRCLPGWWKIRLTAALCRWVQRHTLMHYVLVYAKRV